MSKKKDPSAKQGNSFFQVKSVVKMSYISDFKDKRSNLRLTNLKKFFLVGLGALLHEGALTGVSLVNLVSIFRCSSSAHKHVDSSNLVF